MDLDRDGDLDVVAGGPSATNWSENTTGHGSSWSTAKSIAAAEAKALTTADIDGDVDVVSASKGAGKIAWYENMDGAGSFSEEQVIISTEQHIISVIAADINGYGRLDVASASRNDYIAWYENRGGQFALPTSNVAYLDMLDSSTRELLKIDAIHRGRAGDTMPNSSRSSCSSRMG